MRTKFFVILVAMLLATQSLCFGEDSSRSGNPSGQKTVTQEKPTAKPADKVEIYVTDW